MPWHANFSLNVFIKVTLNRNKVHKENQWLSTPTEFIHMLTLLSNLLVMHGLWGPMKVFMSYWEHIWRHSLALTAQLAGKRLDSMSFPGKKAALYQGKYKSLGPDVATGGCCQKGATLTDTQQSPVIPKTCGSCKNNSPPAPNPCTPATIQSHCPIDRERGMCFFLRVSPLGMMYAWVWVCVHTEAARVKVCITAMKLVLI